MCRRKSYQLPRWQESAQCSAPCTSPAIWSFVLVFSEACVVTLIKNNRGSNADIQSSFYFFFFKVPLCVLLTITSSFKHIFCGLCLCCFNATTGVITLKKIWIKSWFSKNLLSVHVVEPLTDWVLVCFPVGRKTTWTWLLLVSGTIWYNSVLNTAYIICFTAGLGTNKWFKGPHQTHIKYLHESLLSMYTIDLS